MKNKTCWLCRRTKKEVNKILGDEGDIPNKEVVLIKDNLEKDNWFNLFERGIIETMLVDDSEKLFLCPICLRIVTWLSQDHLLKSISYINPMFKDICSIEDLVEIYNEHKKQNGTN